MEENETPISWFSIVNQFKGGILLMCHDFNVIFQTVINYTNTWDEPPTVSCRQVGPKFKYIQELNNTCRVISCLV